MALPHETGTAVEEQGVDGELPPHVDEDMTVAPPHTVALGDQVVLGVDILWKSSCQTSVPLKTT